MTADGVVVGDDGLARCAWGSSPEYLTYHDTEWGVPVHGERALLERITLEAFQSGLSWLTILRKREGFRAAFDGFDPQVVAAYDDADVERLLQDARIVRNRRKIEAAIANARATLAMRATGGLDELFWSHAPATHASPARLDDVRATSPESVALAKSLKTAGFAHVGPTTMYAAMQACGVVDDHLRGCHRATAAA
ncbi:DNA-3-methyladenine glycosylase I [Allobranchiibius sp. CTAmp26]|uniref:DNA-3-methyladenine glycosylase I n=1 Tax=Allobranchiibius sp. CTAmp26 TaxID=2815214 RepID=UPI001AA11B49|nr:DNA-3-methyladenine glycosylase I [Allobranchiibius sp. CTAmp26]MBO1754226.1 DNA-3-methyladenine glycosylase I [Allobranchiibius sp. CTAmp26]